MGQNSKHYGEEIEDAARIIIASKYVVALTGAGISVASGIPPFRGPGGLWTKHGEPPPNGYQRFLEDPVKWWRERLTKTGFYRDFIETLSTANPNPSHFALAELEKMGLLKCVITQNIDNLHRRAGSQNIAEIHGNAFLLRCIECGQRFEPQTFSITLDSLPPKCPTCKRGIIKTDTVFFGEPIPEDVLKKCFLEASKSDCMLTIGTSALVYPAAGLPIRAKQINNAWLIEINPYETAISDLCDVVIRRPSDVALPQIVNRIKELKGLI
ncbi:MAG: NAD-dependent deacylase [Candidatus Jordarchaeaceae archaeon]